MKMIKKNWKILMVTLLICALAISGGYMHKQRYQMAILIDSDNPNDSEWPSKRKWFDASEWLKNPQYIKIDDFYILNKKHIPIENINIFGITRRLQSAIKNSVYINPELSAISKMDEVGFFNLMNGNLSYEYLRTEFDDKTLQPINDYFLVFFSFKGEKYEVELLRTSYNDGYIFMAYGSKVRKSGYWHSVFPAEYSYRDYLKGKPVK